MATLTYDLDDRSALAALGDVLSRLRRPAPLLREIGEELMDSTMRRFGTGTAPDGERWAPNSQVTILQYLAGRGGVYGKDGRLNKKGAGLVQGKKPLIGETRNLSTTITYLLDGDRTLLVGSPEKYAAVQQFGARQGEFGTAWQSSANRVSRHNNPIPWGDIPARPFLGISDADERTILDLARSYFGGK